MNRSRRLILQLTAAGVATSGIASLQWALAAAPQASTLAQELRKLHYNVKSRTATRTATLAFANEMKTNRDNAIKRLMEPTFAPRLSELPLPERTTIGNLVYGLVGNASSPALSWSGQQIDAASYALSSMTELAGMFILGVLVPTGNAGLPPSHPCSDEEEIMLLAAYSAVDAFLAYSDCNDAEQTPRTETNIRIFGSSVGDSSNGNSESVVGAASCEDLYRKAEEQLRAYTQARLAYEACMAG